MKAKQTLHIALAIVATAVAGSGCVSHTAESPYRFEDVRATPNAARYQPYRIEDVHLTVVADQVKMLEALEQQNKGFTARLNGALNGTDYSANARAAKEEMLDRMETMKIAASANFSVDEDQVTLPMLAFFEGFMLSMNDEELAELGLPSLKLDEEADMPRIRNLQQRRERTEGVKKLFGADAGNPEQLTAQLAKRYPGMFDPSGKSSLRVFVAIWGSPVMKMGQFSHSTDMDFHAGVWVLPAKHVFKPDATVSAPGHEFEAAEHSSFSSIGLTGCDRTYPDAPFVKGNAAKSQEFLMDRLCASIVEAINKMTGGK